VISDTITLNQLSPSLKCVYDEIKRYDSTKCLQIVQTPFNDFYEQYPQLCITTTNCTNTSPQLQSQTQFQTTTISDIEQCLLTEILPGIYLGSENDAKNYDLLSKHNIKAIINVSTNIPCYFEEKSNIDYLRLPCVDTCKQNLVDYFKQTFEFIKTSIDNNKNVLVQCGCGVSRSPTIVIGYLMCYHPEKFSTMNDAYLYVKQKRPIISPNLNFLGQLVQYEKQLKEQSTTTTA